MTDMELPYGHAEDVARKFNLSPQDAQRAIAGAEAVNGPQAFRWLVNELRRLHLSFEGEDAICAEEVRILTALALRADSHGVVRISRRELADAAETTPDVVMSCDPWGTWRKSFRVRRVSERGTPRVNEYRLRHWTRDD